MQHVRHRELQHLRLANGLARRLWVAFVVWCTRTEATSQCPALVRLNGMSERLEPNPADRAVPVHRDAEDAPRFFILSGMRAYVAANHSEDPVWFFAVTGHWACSCAFIAGDHARTGMACPTTVVDAREPR
jgi:hypothetical protein